MSSSKKGSAPPTANTTTPALSRGSMTSNGSSSAMQFLSSRWKAIEEAAANTSVAANDKPEIFNSKVTAAAASVATANPPQQAKAGGGQPKTLAWGRR